MKNGKPKKLTGRYRPRKTWGQLGEVQAKIVGAELETIFAQAQGPIRAKEIVRVARNPRSSLHRYFEWDNTAAAAKWREHQARRLLHYFDLEIVETGLRTPAFVSLEIESGDGGGGYERILEVMGHAEKRAQLLKQALEEAEEWRRRYAAFQELSNVFDAIRGARRKLAVRKIGVPRGRSQRHETASMGRRT